MNASSCATRRYSLRIASKANSFAAAVSTDTTGRVTRSCATAGSGCQSRIRRSARLAAKPRVCYEGMDCEEI